MIHQTSFGLLLTLSGLGLALPAAAQPAPAPAAPASAPAISFKTVAQALAALEARDGNGTIVTHPDGWVVVNEPAAAAQWSFVPAGHGAYPAVVRRTIARGADGKAAVQTASLCEATPDACAKLLVEFEGMNDRITQAVRARSRQGSTQP